MANTNDLYGKMSGLWSDFEDNHNSFSEKGNKAAGTRARKAIGEINIYINCILISLNFLALC